MYELAYIIGKLTGASFLILIAFFISNLIFEKLFKPSQKALYWTIGFTLALSLLLNYDSLLNTIYYLPAIAILSKLRLNNIKAKE